MPAPACVLRLRVFVLAVCECDCGELAAVAVLRDAQVCFCFFFNVVSKMRNIIINQSHAYVVLVAAVYCLLSLDSLHM